MTETIQTPPYTLGPNDKTAQVMAYTANALYWGTVVVKEMIRVSTWLRTNSAPDHVCLYNARMLFTAAAPTTRPMAFTELHLAVSQISIFHLLPPAADPPDYDSTEPNRRMLPVTVMISNFKIEGSLRLSTSINLDKYLEVTREKLAAVYDAKISSPLIPSLGTIAVPYVMFRQEQAVFTLP